MCGIVGYVGDEQAAPILLTGLSKLEYRGYDSAGIAVRNEATDKIAIVKAKGRLKTLIEKTDGGSAVPGTCGIGHTRWATHGEPSETNAPVLLLPHPVQLPILPLLYSPFSALQHHFLQYASFHKKEK